MKLMWKPLLIGCIVQLFILPKTYAVHACTGTSGSHITGKALANRSNSATGAGVCPTQKVSYFRLLLSKDPVNTEDVIIRFDSTAKAEYSDDEDAQYLQGFGGVHLYSFSKDGIPLAINVLPPPKQTPDTIRLDVSANTDGLFQLSMKEIKGISPLYEIWLIDKYKKDSLDMRQNNTYSFDMYKNDIASFGSNRFALVIRQDPAYAYKLLNFTATKMPRGKRVQLSWNTVNEGDYTNFTIERGFDSRKKFDVIGDMKASGSGAYSLIDENPVTGQNLYYLKQENINNDIFSSDTVAVLFSDPDNFLPKNMLTIYPNPVSSTIINMSIMANQGDNISYDIKLMNSSGLVVKQATSSQSSWQCSVGDLEPGTYVIRVLNAKNGTLIGQGKLVKL